METKKTKKYNYFYYGMPITRSKFLEAVPEKWEDWVINGYFSWGGYDAEEIDEEIDEDEE